jgi:hypothetical protein
MKLNNSYYWFKSALSAETCEKIIELGKNGIRKNEESGNASTAYTFGFQEKQANPNAKSQEDLPLYEISNEEKTYIRDSKVAWLEDSWLYETITPFIAEANKKAGWNWEYDYHESFQFTQYDSPGGLYGWHKDGESDWHGIFRRHIDGIHENYNYDDGRLPAGFTKNHNMVGKVRKISMTINLNKPGEYEGGNLKFDFGMHVPAKDRFHICEEIRPQGSIIVFPSFLDHCVTPVTSGTRYSLVLWTLGAPWK